METNTTTTTTQTIAEALHRCAEIKQHWSDQPANQRPPISAAEASQEWWERWFTSPEKAECDRILYSWLDSVPFFHTTPNTNQP